jgi:hypothetical protein
LHEPGGRFGGGVEDDVVVRGAGVGFDAGQPGHDAHRPGGEVEHRVGDAVERPGMQGQLFGRGDLLAAHVTLDGHGFGSQRLGLCGAEQGLGQPQPHQGERLPSAAAHVDADVELPGQDCLQLADVEHHVTAFEVGPLPRAWAVVVQARTQRSQQGSVPTNRGPGGSG